MAEYEPLTLKAREAYMQGVDVELVKEIEQNELAKADAQGQAALFQRHPDAARPDVMERIGLEIAQNVDKYRRRLLNESPSDVYEDAYARSQTQSSLERAAGLARPRFTREQLAEVQEVGKANPLQAARMLGANLYHPDLDSRR